MAGIYIHIPFCKRKCSYCDFHFSTSLKKKDEMISALITELILRKKELNTPIETIYFGGGTPSILDIEDIQRLLQTVYDNFKVIDNPEISLEANPDDLSKEKITALYHTKINRLSIGIQSFFEEDLRLMNRAHSAKESKKCLELATQYFDNITIDLIYGVPKMSNEKWLKNIKMTLDFGIPHISNYALTVEPKTALQGYIKKGKIDQPSEQVAFQHFELLLNELTKAGFIHYELSNFAKEGYFSNHNTSYWLGKTYLGIGPSAHSYNGNHRSWNISNNMKYVQLLQSGILPNEIESLTLTDKYNEYIMTGLRTMWGISLLRVEQEFGVDYLNYLKKMSKKHLNRGLLQIKNHIMTVTAQGKFLSDGISADLFKI